MAGSKFKWISGLKRIFTASEEIQKELAVEPQSLIVTDPETEEKSLTTLINEFSEDLDFYKQKVAKLEQKLQQNVGITKQLIDTVLESIESTQTTSNDQDNGIPSSKLDGARTQLIEHKVEELRKKYDSILDILAEKFANEEKLPNLFIGDVSLKELWRKHPNNKDVLLYSIAYMMKKEFEGKGVKIR